MSITTINNARIETTVNALYARLADNSTKKLFLFVLRPISPILWSNTRGTGIVPMNGARGVGAAARYS